MENIPKYSSHFSQKPCVSLGPCIAMGWLWGRTTRHSLFCFLPEYVSIKSFALPEPQRMRRRGKKHQGCQWNPSWIRWHKPHIQKIKLNLWKGTAEKLVDFKMSYNSCVLVGQQQLPRWLRLARLMWTSQIIKIQRSAIPSLEHLTALPSPLWVAALAECGNKVKWSNNVRCPWQQSQW